MVATLPCTTALLRPITATSTTSIKTNTKIIYIKNWRCIAIVDDYVDTMCIHFMIKPDFKDIVFNDFKSGIINGVRRKWKCRMLKKPKQKQVRFTGICASRFYANYDKFYYKNYSFSGGYGNYSLLYSHYKYRDDYVYIHLQHNAIKGKDADTIYTDVLMLVESIGIDLEMLQIDRKINRIDYKRDFECELYPAVEKQASLSIMSKLPTGVRGVNLETYETAIKYKPKSSCGIEIIVYFKDEQLKKQKKKGLRLQIKEFENVIRVEVRDKNKRLNYNRTNTFEMEKTIDHYYKENIADEHFSKYVETIFYKEPFYRIDYAIIAIQNDSGLTEKKAEKLCQLVKDINIKGFTRAKAEYNYCDDTFAKHIKLLRSIGINPLTFDENIDLAILHNFTTKEVCRDYSLYDELFRPVKKKNYDEWGFEIK